MTGQEGKTASQLQIDIQANVFVCCEKWYGRDSDHCASLPPARRLFSLIFFLPPSSAAECAESTENNSLIHGRVLWRRTDFPKAIPHLLYFAISMATGHFLYRNVPSIVSRIGGKSNSVGGRSQTQGVICSALNNLTASGEQH